ncbi:MAG: inorganic phosphate transporter [Candidatus Omnitrophota bacterium]
MSFFTIFIAILLAMNVGARNSSAEMAAAYTSGARTKKEALILIAIFVILGAIIAGLPVVKTLGGGLVSVRTFKAYFYIVFVVMGVMAFFDFISSVFKAPIPASYVIVSSIAAAGLYYESLSVEKFSAILRWWIFSPIAAFILAFLAGKFLNLKFARFLGASVIDGRMKAVLGAALSFSGCYVAFAGGANGAAKAMGPIVAAGIIDNRWGVLLGGAGIAAGALMFGGAILEKSGGELAQIGLIKAISIETICATILLAASFKGIPVSVSVTAASSLVGLGCADLGFMRSMRQRRFLRTIFVWLLVPFSAGWVTYFILNTASIVMR